MQKQKKMSVCFADMAGWRRLVDKFGARKAVAVLQTMMKKAGDIIVRHRGRIRKYIGDAILFTFAKPRDAVLAATEIAATCKRSVGEIDLTYSVAVATGPVFVCRIGHPSFKTDDVMGATVNAAALLVREAMRSAGGVALCEETKRLV
ncbi:MAG: adenylate/guanylate cyclase domain-containing protein [Planctomycetota bacterium]|nr:adenylate/guanylate cyclase domain-containing protein [Planctomycetota bacterium]